MSLTNILIIEHSTTFYIAISIIPIAIIIIGGIYFLKSYDKKITDIYGGRKATITEKNVNINAIETASREIHIKSIKENINQTIKQRNLVSRIKMEVQSFEEMIRSGRRINDSDFAIINSLNLDLDNQINILKEYLIQKNDELVEFSRLMIDQKITILIQIQQSVGAIIQSVKSADIEKYIEYIDKIEFNHQALVKLYQIMTMQIHEQLSGENK